jgi:hypothetical protein
MFDFLDFIWTFDFYIEPSKILSLSRWVKWYFVIILLRVIISNIFALKHRLTVYHRRSNKLRWDDYNVDLKLESSTLGLFLFFCIYTLKSFIPFILMALITVLATNTDDFMGAPIAVAYVYSLVTIVGNIICALDEDMATSKSNNFYWSWWGIDFEIFLKLKDYINYRFTFVHKNDLEKLVLTSQNDYLNGSN